jgi:hypothetical protein
MLLLFFIIVVLSAASAFAAHAGVPGEIVPLVPVPVVKILHKIQLNMF